MPELPEVETIRRTLQELVVGKTIKNVSVFWPKIIKKPVEIEQFTDALQGETFTDINRRGKFLIINTNTYALVSHLRMEGKYGLFSKEETIDKHTHVIFHFTDGTELRYRDVRKFGTMHLFLKGEENNQLPLLQLGPEPFSSDFTKKYLQDKLRKTERKIKPALLDQTVVTGLGNIYVDEALFRAQIHPDRKANTLTGREITLLHREIIETLSEAVEKGGSTIRSYVNSQGQIGMFQLELLAYGRKGEPCKRCGTPIEKTVTGGRGTHFCPKCQKIKQ
ncbi:DNA-formamidopyrimidine glycosylase [Heyndrickxia sporothermodurans]|uniref:Formamidopyrimidine-DNA glycosylase n=1 Tax=Heyndrickxia sporothermodurans TaxID=46224 RepID=A0AB37HGF9_9BACI|nr:DNA-formamidopyrimidine glycosylase [Heyndrickxia sporothermodurans]MBL5766303.1 DNA-formamidopyrimidine glycosylase [Heyndrickxia sporothermodurans]MBL5769742.1 DNA-formamidopyrimidine glycosylase [Heyndrickxia sporothermodurans]MBL5773443.1 DNA-formamidopyrimidine glycosylase [Heyndrickxia sporothermodurans]MBL5777600.1 DNA-formamidopyrimidine glycosylase [Heyndrickxia sporothermodurans]MBL5781186.1 DNA-formamidopyrimidine glycosylase [Heyndrickxia sporothermodurans]